MDIINQWFTVPGCDPESAHVQRVTGDADRERDPRAVEIHELAHAIVLIHMGAASVIVGRDRCAPIGPVAPDARLAAYAAGGAAMVAWELEQSGVTKSIPVPKVVAALMALGVTGEHAGMGGDDWDRIREYTNPSDPNIQTALAWGFQTGLELARQNVWLDFTNCPADHGYWLTPQSLGQLFTGRRVFQTIPLTATTTPVLHAVHLHMDADKVKSIINTEMALEKSKPTDRETAVAVFRDLVMETANQFPGVTLKQYGGFADDLAQSMVDVATARGIDPLHPDYLALVPDMLGETLGKMVRTAEKQFKSRSKRKPFPDQPPGAS